MRPSSPAASGAASSLTGALPALLAWTAALLACSPAAARRSTSPERSVPSTPSTLTLSVASQADLLAARSVYLQRAAHGFTGRLEIHFTARLPATSWSLAPEAGGVPAFELVLRGEGAVLPAPGKLVARAVHLRGLVLTGAVAESSVIEVRDEASLRDCAVIDGRATLGPSGAPYLLLRAHGVAGVSSPAQLTVERTWFVRNWQAPDSRRGAPLLATGQDDRDGGYFASVRFSDCVLLGNAFTAELSLAHALRVDVERCLLVKDWPPAPAPGVLLDAVSAARVTVEDSILIVDELARVAKLGRDVPPIAVGHSRLYAGDYHAAAALPAELSLRRSVVAGREALTAAARAALAAAAALPVALPPNDLRQQLMQALRP